MQIFQAITDIMSDVDAIGKNKRNQQQGFNFRGIDDLYNAIHPLLAKHKVFTVPTVLDERTEERKTAKGGTLIYRIMKIRYNFYAVDGSSVECIVVGEGMDLGDKASNKAMSIAHKYALLQVFAIPTEDIADPDASTPPPSQPVQKEPQYVAWQKAVSAEAKKAGCTSPDLFYGAIHRKFPAFPHQDGKLQWAGISATQYASLLSFFESREWSVSATAEVFEDDIPFGQ